MTPPRPGRPPNLRRIQSAIKMVAAAEKLLRDTMIEEFVIGGEVAYKFGSTLRNAKIIGFSEYRPRLKVSGITGAHYWLDVRQIFIRQD